MSQTAALAPQSGETSRGHRRAVIDIGSNTVRLVVYGGPRRAPRVLHNEKVTARLGRDMEKTGRIADEARDIALAGLSRFAVLLRELKVRDIETVATAAPRDAENGAEFLDAVRELGFAPRLLSGQEEAETSADGVLGAFPGARGVVADLGGGSVEFVEVDGQSATHGLSLPLGTLRLPALRAKGEEKFAKSVAKKLRKADYSLAQDRPLYLVGGSFRAFARAAMLRGKSPLTDAHGFEMSAKRAARLARDLSRKKPEDLTDLSGISSGRIAMLPDAAALLAIILAELKPSRVIASAWGLREGLLHGALGPDLRAQDPLLAGVAAFAADSTGDALRMATMVAGWTAAVRAHSGSGRERLRLATIMLALASHRIEPNLRRDHSLDWALHKRWIGISPTERAMVAAAMLAQTGTMSLPGMLSLLADDETLREGQVWGLAIRLCRRIAGCSLGSIVNSELTIVDGALVLRLTDALMPLYNAGTESDLANLADALGLDHRCELL